MSTVCASDTPVAPLGLALVSQRFLYTCRLSEALLNHVLAPAVRKVYNVKYRVENPPTRTFTDNMERLETAPYCEKGIIGVFS